MSEFLTPTDTETTMKEAFQRKATELLVQENSFKKDGTAIKVGLEVEYSLVDENFNQVNEDSRNNVIADNPSFKGDAMTVEMWLKINQGAGAAGYYGVFGKNYNTPPYFVALINSQEGLYFEFNNSDTLSNSLLSLLIHNIAFLLNLNKYASIMKWARRDLNSRF